jgi:hypothetical protein
VRVEAYKESVQLIGSPSNGFSFLVCHRKAINGDGILVPASSSSSSSSSSRSNPRSLNASPSQQQQLLQQQHVEGRAGSASQVEEGNDTDGTVSEEISLRDWDLRFATNQCKFDPKKDSNFITKLHNHAVILFSKFPLGDPVKPTQTLGQLFQRLESQKLMSVSAPCEGVVTVQDTKLSISVGVGDDVAQLESLLRCDRVDINCVIAAVIYHYDAPALVPGILLIYLKFI